MKYFNYLLQAIIIYMSFLLIKTLGINISRKIFIRIFRVIGPIVRTNKIVVSNINRINETIDEGEREKIIDEMWSNYAITFVEYVYLKKFSSQQNHIQIKNKEILEKISNSKKPVIFISGHFSNFELMAMEIYKSKVKLSAIYRPLNNIFLNPLMENIRKKYICRKQIKKGISGTKEILKHFKLGTSIALMIDQRVSQGIRSLLFKNEALTTTIPAQFVKKFNCKIVPIYIERKINESFVLEIMQPISFDNDKTIENITLKLNELLEMMIIRNPNQWIWSHNRWK